MLSLNAEKNAVKIDYNGILQVHTTLPYLTDMNLKIST